MSGIVRPAAGIEAELARRLPRQRETQRGKLAPLVATMLSGRGASLTDSAAAAAVPRPAERVDMRHRWVARLPADPRLDRDAVVRPSAEEAIRHAPAGGTAVPLPDQGEVSARHRMLALSVRAGGRALPPAWRVRETRGAIGSAERREPVARVAARLPAGGGVAPMGDRFHGTPGLTALCRAPGRGRRPRLRRDSPVFADGGETTPAACLARGERTLDGTGLTGKRVATSAATVHEPGHPEPWIIAPSEAPTVHRALDHGLGWGIEAVLSDLESRGFGPEDSRLRHPDRLARLLLVTAPALRWAVSTGVWEAARQPLPAEKKPRRDGRGRRPAAGPPPSGAACAASSASFSS